MDDRTFRNAMGRFATGVTVITTKTADEIHGMTANAFMSVSLNPKLITVSVDNRAKMHHKIKESKRFAVNILSDRQQDISMHFAGQTNEDRAIDFGFMHEMPVIKGSLASVVCDLESSYAAGDHTLFIGKVMDIEFAEGDPLLFYRGKYGIS